MVNLFLLIGLLLLLGFFAGVEIAFVSANKLSIELKKKQGRRSGLILSNLIEKPWVFVGCCILGYGFLLIDLNIGLRASLQFVKGMYAYRQKDAEGLHTIIRNMAGERLTDADRIGTGGLRVCGSINRSLPTQTNLLESETMEAELKALQAMLAGNEALAGQWMKKATELQRQAGYSYGPPNIVKPSYEMYGEWLLQKGRADEALKQFEMSLKYAPNRLLSLQGKQAAEKVVKSGAMALR